MWARNWNQRQSRKVSPLDDYHLIGALETSSSTEYIIEAGERFFLAQRLVWILLFQDSELCREVCSWFEWSNFTKRGITPRSSIYCAGIKQRIWRILAQCGPQLHEWHVFCMVCWHPAEQAFVAPAPPMTFSIEALFRSTFVLGNCLWLLPRSVVWRIRAFVFISHLVLVFVIISTANFYRITKRRGECVSKELSSTKIDEQFQTLDDYHLLSA